MSIILKALLSGGLFLLFDALYLGILRRQHHVEYFQKNLNRGASFRSDFLPFALLVWFLLGLGIEAFVVPYATNPWDAALKGGLLGMIIYGVYDFTNLATINSWTLSFSLQDVIWGTILSALVAFIRTSMAK